MRSVEPEVFLVARPAVDYDELARYLRQIGGERWNWTRRTWRSSPGGCATGRSSRG
jgi:hypothetical protein